MQRLFLMFPDGAPGFALLLMRAIVGGHLWALRQLVDATVFDERTVLVLISVPITALVLGACTPLVATGAAIFSGLIILATLDLSLLPAVMSSVALLLLGPGAYSIDARRFGRRRWAAAGRNARDD